jgi:hypothetical protein
MKDPLYRLHEMKASMRFCYQTLLRVKDLDCDPRLRAELNAIEHEIEDAIEDAIEESILSHALEEEAADPVRSQNVSLNKVCEAVMIDDDPSVGMFWNSKTKKMGKKVIQYLDSDTFLSQEHLYERNTPIFLDWYLCPKSSLTGLRLLLELFQLGFHDICLISTLSNVSLASLFKIKGPISKEKPWGIEL